MIAWQLQDMEFTLSDFEEKGCIELCKEPILLIENRPAFQDALEEARVRFEHARGERNPFFSSPIEARSPLPRATTG